MAQMEKEFTLLDYWQVLIKWRKTVLLTVISLTFCSIVISFFLPKTYKTETIIMPLGGGHQRGLEALTSQFVGIGGLLGGGANDISLQIMAILKSRTLAEIIIKKYDLMKSLYPNLWDEKNQKWRIKNPKDMPHIEKVIDRLLSLVFFRDYQRTKLIGITVEIHDPKLAAQIANIYVEELRDYLQKNTLTASKKNRIFIGERLENAKAKLLNTGKGISEFHTANKISSVLSKADVELSVDEKIDQVTIIKDVPQKFYLQYLTDEIKLLDRVLALLMQEYEMAKIEEAKEDLSFQIIDSAQVPQNRHKPKRKQIVIITFITALFLSMLYVFFREYFEKVRINKI